jgi:hypothetical protein
MIQLISNLRESALTFKRSRREKLAFILLNLIDMGLTIFANTLGAHELNPLMRSIAQSQYQLYITKLALPVLWAWLLPGKLLIPSIALLVLVVGWDIHQLVIYFL